LVSAKDVIGDYELSFQALARAFSQHITFDEGMSGLTLMADEVVMRLIRAALFQYIDNAVQHAEGDGIDVTAVQEGDAVIFQVKSSGAPLPEDEWERIFDLDYRGSNAVGDDDSGSGIGLFQVREIARNLRGRAYYRPERGPQGDKNVFSLAVAGGAR
jgi:signal transduction histidine kinase